MKPLGRKLATQHLGSLEGVFAHPNLEKTNSTGRTIVFSVGTRLHLVFNENTSVTLSVLQLSHW
jgi:hypothetical protein